MRKIFTTLLGAMIGTAMFAAVGVGMAHAHHINGDDSVIVLEGAGGR
jgi:hypothetical protein